MWIVYHPHLNMLIMPETLDLLGALPEPILSKLPILLAQEQARKVVVEGVENGIWTSSVKVFDGSWPAQVLLELSPPEAFEWWLLCKQLRLFRRNSDPGWWGRAPANWHVLRLVFFATGQLRLYRHKDAKDSCCLWGRWRLCPPGEAGHRSRQVYSGWRDVRQRIC